MPKIMEIIEKETKGKAITRDTVMIPLVYLPLITMMIPIK